MSHQTISFLKSFIRMTGYFCLPFDIWMAAAILLFSEVIGIWEEIGHE